MGGLILINRSIFDHHIVGNGNHKQLYAWIWMLSHACWKDTKYNLHGNTIHLKRGQFAASRKYISDKTGLTEKEVRGFLTRLERDGMVIKKGQGKGHPSAVITICNYERYQDFENYRAKLGANEGPTKGQRRANRKKPDKPDIKIEAKASTKKNSKGFRLPDDWQSTPDLISFAMSEGLSFQQAHREADKFRDYWHSATGATATKKRWDLAFRNWVRIAADRLPSGQGKISNTEKNLDMILEVANELSDH